MWQLPPRSIRKGKLEKRGASYTFAQLRTECCGLSLCLLVAIFGVCLISVVLSQSSTCVACSLQTMGHARDGVIADFSRRTNDATRQYSHAFSQHARGACRVVPPHLLLLLLLTLLKSFNHAYVDVVATTRFGTRRTVAFSRSRRTSGMKQLFYEPKPVYECITRCYQLLDWISVILRTQHV
jgi:hypothetical protein